MKVRFSFFLNRYTHFELCNLVWAAWCMAATGFWALKWQWIICFDLEDVQLCLKYFHPNTELRFFQLTGLINQTNVTVRFQYSPFPTITFLLPVAAVTDHSCYALQYLLWSNLGKKRIYFCCNLNKYFYIRLCQTFKSIIWSSSGTQTWLLAQCQDY